jgi:hypothetical protein
MIGLPLYPIRSYEKIFCENGLKYIMGRRNKWVLDYENPTTEDYFERRMKLKREGHELYPLYKGYSTMAQVLKAKNVRKYIDKNGNILSWKPTQFYKLKTYPISQKWIPEHIPRLVFTLDCSSEIFDTDLPNFVANYAQVVEVGNRRILFDISEERKPDTRIKL